MWKWWRQRHEHPTTNDWSTVFFCPWVFHKQAFVFRWRTSTKCNNYKMIFFQWACKYERALKMVSLYRIAHPNAHCSHSLIYNGNFPSNNIKRVFSIHFHFLMRWINLMREIEENQHLSIIHYNENIHNQLQCISCVHNFAFT